MTTIHEMDEFFNFDDASHPPLSLDPTNLDFESLAAGPYDIDLAFAQPEADENSFSCLQHFSSPEQEISSCLQNAASMDTAMMGPGDFSDFPRWIDGMDLPMQPCGYCRRMRIHCKVIKEGIRKGSCTSCVALARSCSLTVNPLQTGKRNSFKSALKEGYCDQDGICVPAEQDAGDWSMDGEFTGLKPKMTWSGEQSPVVGHFSQSNSASDLTALKQSEESMNADLGENGPKVGARFSRESVRILRGWLSTHHRHPYPSDEEKESLRRQTGLNKTQITNWLANARRRGKVRAPRSTSPSVNNYANAMDIPRRGTPSVEQMLPLERWKNSPPENEPASVTAIAKAVTSSTLSSGHDSPYSYGHTDDGSNRSLCNVSSTSSLGTSHSSGGSFASAYSHKSRGSFGSFGSFGNRGRRRRRRQAAKPVELTISHQPVRTFQCTFCTETFKTKHDWQRHEKSLHLSLERWICCPDGPTQFCPEFFHNRCVFCGLSNPPAGHAEEHNYTSCTERSLEERTFYRKDHLRQHLNLVHDVKFQAFSMDTWRLATPEIRSRCGFCGIIMDSWTIRVDHLAEHFKGGKSMADWKGDWGFESQVLDIVENGMPPYLIHNERNSMNPYEASREASLPDRTLEDWVKIGLVEFLHGFIMNGKTPTDDDLLLEARKIIRRADERSTNSEPELSWFRDLIMLSGNHPELKCRMTVDQSWAKKLASISAQAAQSDQSNNLDLILCRKQRALKAFVNSRQALGLTPTNSELQVEACRILDEAEVLAQYKSQPALKWFKYLVTASTEWLEEFRRKVGLPASSEIAFETIRSTDDMSIDYSIHNLGRLEKELGDFFKVQLAAGIIPSDADLQRQARLIIYQNDDPWNQTAADDPTMLDAFKRRNGFGPSEEIDSCLPAPQESAQNQLTSSASPRSLHWELDSSEATPQSVDEGGRVSGTHTPDYDQPLHSLVPSQPSANSNPIQPLKYFLNDAQCYGRLMRELTRFVKTCKSPNNPNQHIPTDAEIQHHARIVIYDDDDPWNQTAADNAEWLIRFKRDVGLAPPENGPGLADVLSNSSWRCESGGSGFSPPYVNPREPPAASYVEDVRVKMEARTFDVKAKTAVEFMKSLKDRYKPFAQVFCSRELENSLNSFVIQQLARGVSPSDEAIRARAREILGIENTPADDVDILEKFKALHGLTPTDLSRGSSLPLLDEAMLAEFDKDLETMDFSNMDVFSDHFSGPTDLLSEEAVITNTPQTQSQDMASLKEYADLYRVNAATSSPLGRRASEKLAQRSGFSHTIAGSQYGSNNIDS